MNDTADLSTALKLRLSDSNKVVQSLALDIVARIASGMGKPFDKHSRTFSAPVANVLADQKTNIRAAGIATLTAMADAAGLDSLISGFEKPLETPNPLLRKELLSWLEARLEDEAVVASLDLTHIAGGILACLEDRSAEVRKPATVILAAVVARAGFGFVMDLTTKLKPASRSTVVPLIEAARSAVPSSSSAGPAAPHPVSTTSTKTTSSTSAAATTSTTSTLKPLAPKAGGGGASKSLRGAPTPVNLPPTFESEAAPPRTTSSRPNTLASRGGLSTTASSRASPVPSSSATREPPFKNADPQPKLVRANRESGSLKWVVDGAPRGDQIESLLAQMTPNTSPDLLAKLFSKDHNSERDFIAALTQLDDCARDEGIAASYGLDSEEMRKRLVVNVDVIFKYITLKIGLTSTSITVKCLDLIDHLIPVLDKEGHRLSDYEVSALLVCLIAKVRSRFSPLSFPRFLR